MKPIMIFSTTTTIRIENVLKAPKKGISIKEGEGGLINAPVKMSLTLDPKDKGKVILIEQSNEEKKKLHEAELERQRQINNIIFDRENDPPGLNKGDPNKRWSYEMIVIVVLGKNDEFLKRPKKIFETENSNFNQLDFPIIMLFTSPQFKVADKFKGKMNTKT